MKFCPYCGKLVDGQPCDCEGYLAEQAAKAANDEEVHEERKKEIKAPKVAMNPKKLIVPVILICALVIGLLVYSTFSNTIDLTDYIEVYGVTGLNSRATIRYGFADDNDFYTAYFGDEYADIDPNTLTQAELMSIMQREQEKLEELDRLESCITFTASQDENLSNGDVVTITATFENPNNYDFTRRIKSGEITYTVEGLEEGKTCDPFDESVVSFKYSGSNGDAALDIRAPQEVPYSYFTYNCDPMAMLSNGDTCTVWVNFDEASLMAEGYLPPENTEKQFVVSGLAELVRSAEQITDKAIMDACKTAVETAGDGPVESDEWVYKINSEPKVEKVYFAYTESGKYQKDPFVYTGTSIQNAIVVFTSYEMSNVFGSETCHNTYFLPQCVINADGSISSTVKTKGVEHEHGSFAKAYEAVTGYYSDMTFVELNIPE